MGGRGAISPLGKDIGFFDEEAGPVKGVDMNVAPYNPQSAFREVDQEKTLAHVETAMKDLDHEQMFIMDDQGYIVSAVDGEKSAVAYTFDSVAKVPGNVVTHNHPRKGRGESGVEGGTFSPADIRSMYLGTKELRAVGNEGTYSMKATGHANPKGLYKALLQDKVAIVQKQKEIARQAEYAYEKGKYRNKHEAKVDSVNRQMGVVHDWYANNASKYGYKYSFTSAEERDNVKLAPPKRRTQKEIDRDNRGVSYGEHKSKEYKKQGAAHIDRKQGLLDLGFKEQQDGSFKHPETGVVTRLFHVKQ